MDQVTLDDEESRGEATTIAEGTTRLRARVGGMHCSLCTETIERALGELPGVRRVAVNLANEQALIDYDPTTLDAEQVQGVVRALGFTVGEASAPAQEKGRRSELYREGMRLLGGTALSAVTLPLMFLDLYNVLGGWVAWLLGVFAVATVVLLAPQLVIVAGKEQRRRGLLNQPVVLQASTLGGLIGGVIGLAASPPHFPTGGFFAVTVLVVTYHTFSRWFALLVRTRSSQAVKKLLDLQPDTVRLVRDGVEHEVPVAVVGVGDRVRVRPGERLPVDGKVTSGASAVDESLVTGESMPVAKREGAEVIGGSINGTGTLVVEITRVGEDTFLQKVIHSIEDARALKPGVIDLVERVLKIYKPAVLVIAALALAFWVLVPLVAGDGPDLNRALFAAISVLIMAYPCAMGMAAPLALVRGAGDAAERGIILRTGEAFQSFAAVRAIVLDKTGTLTEGKFTVREIETRGDTDELLALAAAAEQSSEHPVANAIVAAARARGLVIVDAEEFDAVAGHGVRALVDGTDVVVGKPSYVDVGPFTAKVAELEEAGRTVVGISRDGLPLGVIALGDQVRAEAAEVVAEMKRRGITPVLVTGDNRRAAHRVAAELDIDQVRAEVLPDGKAEIVRELQRDGRVAMVGDGINDAPALAQADVGLAMGAGTDVAIESSDVVIAGNRLDAVLAARDIGARSYRRTQQNVVLAFVFNGVGIPLAATGLLYPIWAMAVMVISVTAVFLNTLRGNWSGVFSTIGTLGRRKADQA